MTGRKSVVSFDYDGVMHLDVDGIHPTNWRDENPTPSKKMHKILRMEAMTHRIVIVTARCENSIPTIRAFLEIHNLPVHSIYATCDGDKMPTLRQIGAIRHYDDNTDMQYEISDDDKMELILVSQDEIVGTHRGKRKDR